MEIKFDVYFKKNLGTLFKDNEVDLNGKHAHTNLPLSLVDRLEINYYINGEKHTDDVLITDVTENLMQIPFKSDVMKAGESEFEIIAYMKNGDKKSSQTYIYNIAEGIGEGNRVASGSSGDGHTHNNLAILNSITQSKVNEWNNKADKVHTHNAAEIEGLQVIQGPKGDKGERGEQGLQGPKGDMGPQGPAGTVDTNNFYDKKEIDAKLSNIVLESGNIVFRDVADGEVFEIETNEIITPTPTPPATYGNIVISDTTLSLNENSTTTFTVKLDKEPADNQVVNISVNNDYCTIDKYNIIFKSVL